jgi:hypothetical protein
MSDTAVPETPKTLNLAQKILEIQKAVGVVKKRGRFGADMGGSNYLRIEDAVVSVNKLLTDHGLILTATLQKKPDGTFYCDRVPHTTKGYIASVVLEWTLEDVTSGEKRSYDFPGDGYDGTDKAVYKAETGSRKYAIINIFNLPVGNDVEEHGASSFEEGKSRQKKVAEEKIAEAAGRGSKTAIDALSQIVPEKKIIIGRPEALNGHYIAVSGLIAVPQLERFFDDTESKRYKSKTDETPYWRVPAEYEKGLIALCQKLEIEVEG